MPLESTQVHIRLFNLGLSGQVSWCLVAVWFLFVSVVLLSQLTHKIFLYSLQRSDFPSSLIMFLLSPHHILLINVCSLSSSTTARRKTVKTGRQTFSGAFQSHWGAYVLPKNFGALFFSEVKGHPCTEKTHVSRTSTLEPLPHTPTDVP